MKIVAIVLLTLVILSTATAYASPAYFGCIVTDVTDDVVTVTIGSDDYAFYGDGFNEGDLIFVTMESEAITNASYSLIDLLF